MSEGAPDDISLLRPPKRGAKGDAVVHGLFLSISASSLRSVYMVTKMALMFSDKELEGLGIDPSAVRVINQVASVLGGVKAYKHVLTYYGNKPYQWVECFPVKWGFKHTRENFDRFIQPWFNRFPEFFAQFVTPVEKFKVFKTKVSCSSCKTEFLDLMREESERAKALVEKRFSDQIESKKMLLITAEDYEHDKEYYSKENYFKRMSRYLDFPVYKPYIPPHLVLSFFPCPECGKHVILDNEPVNGSYYKYTDAMVKRVEAILRETHARLSVEDYDYLLDEYEHHVFFEASQWWTEQGFREFCNQFTGWALDLTQKMLANLLSKVPRDKYQALMRKVFKAELPFEEGEEKEEKE